MRTLIKDVIIAAAVLMFILLMFSCRTAKDRKARDRVLSNSELLEQVGREWEKRNPCFNDTVYSFMPGDTLIEIDTVTETVLDTITQVIAGQTKTVYKTITKTITIRDTIKISVEDTRRLGIALDSFKYYKFMYQRSDEQVQQHKEDKKDLSKTSGWAFNALVRKWHFWILILLVAGYLTRRFWMGKVGFLNR